MTITLERPGTVATSGTVTVYVSGLPLVLRGGVPEMFDGEPVSATAKAWRHLDGVRRKPIPGHGVPARHSYWGCRCVRCRAERFRTDKLRKAGKLPPGFVSPVKARRQIQALNAVGFSDVDIADYIDRFTSRRGLSRRMLQAVATGRHGAGRGLARRTATLIDVAYQTLSELPPPAGGYAGRVRRQAKAAGYVPPEAWLDETIGDPDAWPYKDIQDVGISDKVEGVLRLISADPVVGRTPRQPALWGTLRAEDRVDVIRALNERRMTFNRIAVNLGIHTTALQRWLHRRKLFMVEGLYLVPWRQSGPAVAPADAEQPAGAA